MVSKIEDYTKPIVLPALNAKLLYGIEPVVFTREDMATDYSWYKFCIKHDIMLDARDFKEYDTYMRYWLISLGLLEYPCIFLGGPRGNGKSLLIAWLTRNLVRLFNKRATLDKVPPNPKLFGNFHLLYDSDYIERVQDELNDLDKKEKHLRMTTGQGVPRSELEKLILFNAVFGLDECDEWAERSHRTNLTKLIARIINRSRHFYMIFILSMIDPNRFDILIYNRTNKTHEVTCGFNWFPKSLPGYCSYQIKDVRANGTGVSKWLHLNPADHTELWDSHAPVGISHSVDVYLGGKKRPEKKEEKQHGLL